MPRVIETTVYQYGELTDKAKEKARDWFREITAGDTDFADSMTGKGGDFETVAKCLGWTVNDSKFQKGALAIYWSGFGSQGDGLHFEGSWKAADVNAAELKAHAPLDNELHRLADAFAKLAAELSAGIGASKSIGRYSHEHAAEIHLDCDGEPDAAITDEASIDMGKRHARETRALMRWMYRALQAEYMHQSSDEAVAETIIANEYEFLESGKRA